MIEAAQSDSPFEQRASLPDVRVAHAAFRRLCDVLLLKEFLDGLGHHCHGVVDVRRLVLAIDQLETEQACPTDDMTRCFFFGGGARYVKHSDVRGISRKLD